MGKNIMQKAGTMMTSSNGNIFRVTGHLCGELTDYRWIPRTLRLNERFSKQWWGWWFETPSHPLWRHCNDKRFGRPWVIYIYIWFSNRLEQYILRRRSNVSDSLQWRHNEWDGVSYTGVSIACSTLYLGVKKTSKINENIKAPHHWSLWWE